MTPTVRKVVSSGRSWTLAYLTPIICWRSTGTVNSPDFGGAASAAGACPACPPAGAAASCFITGTRSIEQIGHLASGSFDLTDGCIVQV